MPVKERTAIGHIVGDIGSRFLFELAAFPARWFLSRLRDPLRAVNLRLQVRAQVYSGRVDCMTMEPQNVMTRRSQPPETSNNLNSACWVQLNVSLVRQGGLALDSARALFDETSALVDVWRGAARLQWFFFMRKPPDVRLRFRVRDDRDIRPSLCTAMAKLRQKNRIHEYSYAKYQPETHRFGGPRGMSRVHEYFDADTALWLRLDRLDRQGQRRLTPGELLPAIVQDLFIHAGVNDPNLVAASWRNLRTLVSISATPRLPIVSREALNGLSRISTVQGAERECLEMYSQANAALARTLRKLMLNSLLQVDLADVLATVALFSFHRHGFAGHQSLPLVVATMNALQIEQGNRH